MVAAIVVFWASHAMAGGTKPPKNICIQTIPDSKMFELAIKKGLKAMYGHMKINMYTIQGLVPAPTPIPLNGTGYMADDIFYFQINSSFTTNLAVSGGWDVVAESGSAVINETKPGGFTTVRYSLGPCLTMP